MKIVETAAELIRDDIKAVETSYKVYDSIQLVIRWVLMNASTSYQKP